MGQINSEELKQLLSQRTILIKQYNNKLIMKEDFDTKLSELDKKRTEILNKYLEGLKNPIKDGNNIILNKQLNTEEPKMAEDTSAPVKKEKKIKEAKPKRDTRAKHIIAALQMKSVKNVDDVVKYVKQQRPADPDSKIKSQTKVIIKEIIAKKRPVYETATWDQEKFLLTLP